MTAQLSETAVELRELAEKLRATTETSQPDLQASLASVRQTADHGAYVASLEQIVAGNGGSRSSRAQASTRSAARDRRA
jgi:hypothetical protein